MDFRTNKKQDIASSLKDITSNGHSGPRAVNHATVVSESEVDLTHVASSVPWTKANNAAPTLVLTGAVGLTLAHARNHAVLDLSRLDHVNVLAETLGMVIATEARTVLKHAKN